MDSYQSFIETFQQAISTRDLATLTNNLKSGQGFLAIISLEDRESLVHSIFDRSDGLLCFLKYELERRVADKNIDNACTEGFHFLKFFIKNFYTTSCFAQYILQLKDVCQLALIIKCSFYTKKAACNVFTKLIELFRDHDLKLSETVKKFIDIYRKNNSKDEIKDRRLILCVCSKIVKYNGNVCLSQKYLISIFKLLYSDMQEYNPNINVPNDFHIYFDVFADMLDSVEPPEQIRKKLFCKSYEWIKNLSQQDRQQSIVISAIDLLNRHMNSFQDYLYPDCQYWYNFLRRLSRKTTTSGVYGQRALKTFYRMIGHILTEIDSGEDAPKLLSYFLEEFEREFKNTDLDLTILQLVVYGFSQMAAPCKLHLNQYHIGHMYSIITSYALPLCSSEQSNSKHIENICCYQEALSEMLCHMTDVTIEKINVLVKLSIYIIKRFPDLVISNNALAVSALIKTISKLASINKNLVQQYLDNIIYDGIAWSCSHTLALDAELQRELKILQQSPIYYKNYLPLWTELLNIERYSVRGCEQMAQHVASTLMNVCITLVGRLDIRVKRINEDTVYSDVALTQTALNQADFRVFTNLVDLYIDVIDAIDTSKLSLFANTVCRFLFEIVRLSYRYPLISGLYKLVRTGMKIFVACASEEEEDTGDSQRIKELLSNYLSHTLDLIPTFSNELLIACLYLILDSPYAYFKDALPRMLPIFRIAFTIGLSNLELAYTALTSLQTWTEQERQQERTNELLREIIVYLEPYLRSTESSIEVSQDLMMTRAKSRVKRVEVIDTECMLRNFQRRVLLFLGSLDHDLLSSFVHDRASRSTGASWDHKNLLKYTLLLPDARPDIYFDRMFPRIIALARESSDRRTKIAACEVLHSMITLIIGSTARHLSNPENHFTALYGILCPTMLVLGCDSDEVVRGLFQPLTLQLMHWFSSRLMLMSPIVSPVLDSLFESLTDDSNPALREFSGTCLAEFTRWSIKQAPEVKDVMQSNVHRIVQKINELALHPSMRKRVAAAVAFNHLYAILREDDDTVSIYWLEIFYSFVCSLNDECDDPSIANALVHIEKVMRFKADLLNAPGPPDRRKPHEFDGATLTHAMYWLLSRCGTLDERCRAKCMELYVNMSQYIYSCPQETIQIFVETYGMDRLNDIVLRGLESGVGDISVIGNVTPLLKALDCYVWFLENQLLSTETLFSATDDAQEHTIFSCIQSFTRQFQQLTENPAEMVVINSREFEQLQTLQCKTLMATLNFIQMLLNINVNVLPNSLWDESLSALTIKCIMSPRAIGFNIRNIEMTDKLPHVLEILLNAMKSQLTYALPNTFKNCLLNFGQKHIARLLYLKDIAQNNFSDNLIQHVKGLILLQRCNMLDRMMIEKSSFTQGEKTIERIFKFLVNKRIGVWICSNLNAQMIEYLRTLMEFQLSLFSSTIEAPNLVIPEDTRSITETLMKFISNNTLIIGTDSAQIIYGEYFLNMFKDTIFGFMLTHIAAITLVFDDLSRDNPFFLLKWLEDLLLYLKQHKREFQAHVDATVDVILRHFTCLKNAVCNNDSRKERLMNIYGTVVHLSSKPVKITRDSAFPEIYQWILDQLIGSNSLEYKTQILQRFFICLTDATTDDGNDNLELRRILLSLKNNNQELFLNLSETSVNAMKVIDCFETLLTLLSITKSIIMLECVIRFAAGTGDRLCQDEKIEEHLREYYREASSECALQSLKITYSTFMNRDFYFFERLDILRSFLLPMFKFCDAITIQRFFEQNIRDLHELASDLITTTDNTNAKHTIVSKIGCFQLITILFATVDMNKLVDVNATIALNALHQNIKIGKEFIQSLLKLAYKTRTLRVDQPGCNELMRLLYCSAYNCELTIINLKEEEWYYISAFSENHSTKPKFLLWENIVDCNKRYQLGQTFKEYPKTREITINMRSMTFNVDGPQHRYAYVHSYDLSASTLCEDINAYDFNRSVSLPFNSHHSVLAKNLNDPRGQTSIALEIDDFNKHECMPYICVLLRRIREIFVSSKELPKAMARFLNGLNKSKPNIILFRLRIIWNTNDVFKSYAKFMLIPIVEAITNYLGQNDLNYIITDIIEILMDWHDVAVPNDEEDRKQAQNLFEKLIDKVLIETSNNERRVYDYNLSLIKNMVEKWHCYLRVPNDLLNRKMIFVPKAAVYLILVLLDNGMTEEIVARDDIIDFLLKPLRDWKTPEIDKTPLQCSECLGLYLKSLDKRNEVEIQTKKRELREKILTILGPIQLYQISKQVKRIAVLCRTYPEVTVDYINVILNAMAKNVERPYCLEIFTLFMTRLSPSDDESTIMNYLRHMQLQEVLINRVSFCEKLVLGIVGDLVTILSPSDLLLYVNLTIPYIKDVITEHRDLVYDILMKVYRKYSADMTAKDDAIQTLLSVSVEKLLAGLLDPSQELQDRILRFWTEETRLSTEKSKNRLLGLLSMHSLLQKTTMSEDNAFAPFIALLMLQLVTKSIDYNKNIFDAPLHSDCTFENYKVAVSWRRRNLSCMAPMFVDSLASQMSYGTFSQINDTDFGSLVDSYSRFSRYSGIPLRLRATQDLQFEPTLLDNDEITNATLDAEFDRTITASSSRQSFQNTTRKRPFRLLANSSDIANIIRHKQIQKNVQRTEMMKQESIRQRSSVKLYRDYKIGDFPDIEISHSNLIVPLQQLIKLDRLICKDVTVSLLCSLIKEITEREKSDDFRQAIVDSLKKILQNLSERDSSFNAVILEILLQLNATDCNPLDIAKISKTSRLDVLGALLLERNLLPDPRDDDSSTPSKRMRRCDNDETDKWMQLACLYKSLNDVDVVLSIFRGRQFFGDDMQQAAFAEVNGDWIQARDVYTSAYERIENRSMREHCFQGLLKAVENLCDWSTINQLVKSRTSDNNLDGVWNDTWNDWTIPYVFDAYVHMLAEGNWTSSDDDLVVIQSWMNDRDKLKYLKHMVGKNLIIFLLMGEEQQRQSTNLLNELLDKMGEQWVSLNPLCIERGIRESLKLQVINDLNTSLKVLRCANEANYLDRLDALLNFWSSKIPTIQDNLIQWNKLTAYRTYFSMLFENNMKEDDDENEKCAIIKERMHQSRFQLRLGIADAALHQKHRYIAERHLNYMNEHLQSIRQPHLKLPLKLSWLEARIKCLCADIETDARTKMINYTASWKCSHQLLNECGELDVNMHIAIRQHVGALASKIEFSSRKNAEFANALASNAAILQKIGIAESTLVVDLNNIREHLLQYSLNNLRACCENATRIAAINIGEHYCALARHCYGRLTSTDMESNELFHEFLLSTLRSMRYDYLEAAHYFPCLLKPERLQNEEIRTTFVRECAELQPWLFLRWQDLLFSHLGTPSIASAIVSIVERIAEAYPDAVAYTYHLVIERNPAILQERNIQRVRSLLHDKAEKYEQFLRAIQYVAQPELYLKHYLNEVMRDVSRGRGATAIESLLRKVYPKIRAAEKNNPHPGNIYQIIARYESEIRALNPDNHDATREGIQRLKKSLTESLSNRENRLKNKLNDYSPFLHQFMGGDIEVPGQYTDDKEPILRYHARIARFEPRVVVMQSLRKPIRICMVGDNGKEYKFLVKFGEDLTIDRGLQQLYATMNRTLRNDASCRQRRLAIDTYEVIPLSKSFGLIQWIEDTKSLDDLVRFTLSKRESDQCKSIRDRYMAWIASATFSKQIVDQYKEAVSRYSWRTVTEQMERFVGETKRTALRDAFDIISPSPECFVTLRRNFVASYATMCAAHWLAGIGDRHLQNTLVRVTTGRCLGIDFGHAFGGGLRTSIPELVPFRLTPQILELLLPFTERDLLATIMTHVMRALRDDCGPILACMDIFIHKPINRSSNINDDEIATRNGDEQVDADTWSSKRNIEIVAKKLNGIHPSLITLEQLKEAHDDEYFTRYHAIVMGIDGVKQARADIKNDCLTPAEQVILI
ncbi:hypothetical protein ACFW04_009296 [Cataglyphis niger]